MGINLSIGPEESPPGLGSSAKNQQNWFLDSSVGESGVFFYKRPSGLGGILILVTWNTVKQPYCLNISESHPQDLSLNYFN